MSFKIRLTFSLSSLCVYYALKHLIKRKSNLQNYNAPNYINWYVTHIKVYLKYNCWAHKEHNLWDSFSFHLVETIRTKAYRFKKNVLFLQTVHIFWVTTLALNNNRQHLHVTNFWFGRVFTQKISFHSNFSHSNMYQSYYYNLIEWHINSYPSWLIDLLP